MALFGTLEVLENQSAPLELLKEGLKYLETVNMHNLFADVEVGKSKKVEIKGKQLFAIFQEYDTKPLTELKFEGHKKYIDIQFIYSGQENIGITGINQVTEFGSYDDDRDIHFSKVAHYSNWLMMQNDAAIFYPSDMHAPSMAVDVPSRVKKVVIKIAV